MNKMELSGRVYLQYFRGIPVTVNIYSLQTGFEAKGYELIPVEIDIKNFSSFEIKDSVLSNLKKEDILCSGIPLFQKQMKYMVLSYKEQESYPKELEKFLERKIETISLKEFYSRIENNFPAGIFIKPVSQKQFTGTLIQKRMDLLKIPAQLPDETMVHISEPIKIISEYRVYVNQNDISRKYGILDIKRYNGSIFENLDYKKIEKVISYYNDSGASKCYGIDFAVIESSSGKKKTVLVEVNGALQLGSYGLNPYIYADLMRDAWIEFMERNAE